MKPSRSTKVVTAMDNVPSWSSIALYVHERAPQSVCVSAIGKWLTAEMVLGNSALLAEVMITTITWSGPHDYRWEEFSWETRSDVNCLHWVIHGVSGKARNSSPVLRSSCAYNTTLLFISQEFLCKQACSYFVVFLCSTPSQLHPYSSKMYSNTCEWSNRILVPWLLLSVRLQASAHAHLRYTRVLGIQTVILKPKRQAFYSLGHLSSPPIRFLYSYLASVYEGTLWNLSPTRLQWEKLWSH